MCTSKNGVADIYNGQRYNCLEMAEKMFDFLPLSNTSGVPKINNGSK